MLLRIFIIINILLVALDSVLAATKFDEGEYFLDESGKHKIHVLVLDPKKYDMQLVSSHDSVFGRRTVDEITQSANGDIGVNAGFFEIGKSRDGMPSGALIIDGKFYGMQGRNLPCIIQRKGQVSIENFHPKLNISIERKDIKINQFNKFIINQKVYLYNDNWGKTTLSSHDNRQEIVIGNDNRIIAFNRHGNSHIPAEGHVISLAKGHVNKLDDNIIGKEAKFNWSPKFTDDKETSVILGIPRLIENGLVIKGLNDAEANARTAFGITKEGHYVIVVVEHFNMQDIKNLTLQDVREMLKDEKIAANEISVADLKKLIQDKMQSSASVVGFTTKELAEYMLKKGCVNAINLDGGGSSSLYMNGRFVNTAFGDVDEGKGMQVYRAVANALVFKRWSSGAQESK